VTVIPLGLNPFYGKLPKKDPDLAAFRAQRGLVAPFLLYAGTLEPRKNIGAVIRAFGLLKKDARFRGLKLVLAGAPGWLYRSVFREAATSEAASDILFWGSATFTELRSLYNLAEAFVFPSFFEGFGLPPLEAQACGTPVIVSNRSSLPEVIGSSGMLVDPWDIGGIAEALHTLLSDDALRAHYAARGLENAARFDWEATADRYAELFRKLSTDS
jgi:glycosyltransferase involved in cell wall biosynthesis